MLATVFALGVVAAPALAVVNDVFPSTNDANRALGWAHVDQVSVADGAMTLSFVSTARVRELLRVSARTATRRRPSAPATSTRP